MRRARIAILRIFASCIGVRNNISIKEGEIFYEIFLYFFVMMRQYCALFWNNDNVISLIQNHMRMIIEKPSKEIAINAAASMLGREKNRKPRVSERVFSNIGYKKIRKERLFS